MLCLSPFSEDKPHARFFFFQCSVHSADCAAGRAAADSLRAARPGGVSAVFRAGIRSGAPARRAGAALHLRRAAVVCGYGAEYAATLNTYMPMWIAPILLVACFVFGLVGGVIGKAICKKHFQRAGIA